MPSPPNFAPVEVLSQVLRQHFHDCPAFVGSAVPSVETALPRLPGDRALTNSSGDRALTSGKDPRDLHWVIRPDEALKTVVGTLEVAS